MGLGNRHFRSVLSLIVAVVLIIAVSYLGIHTLRASHAATGVALYLTPDSASIASGSTVSFTVRENSGSDAVNSVQATIGYDSAALQYVGLNEGTAFPVTAATNTSTPGVIRIARAASGAGVTGDNPVLTINFKVVGTASAATKLSFDRANSYIVRSSDNSDILESVGAGTYTITASSGGSTAPGSGTPRLSLDPASQSYGPGSTISVAVNLQAYATSVTTVEATISYPATQLQYIGVNEGNGFVVRQRTAARNGTIDIIRGVSGGSTGLKGDNTVVSLSFKVIGTSGTAALSFVNGSALFDNSGTGTNVLDLSASKGASYTIAANAPVTTATTTPNVPTTSVASPAQAATIRSSGSSGSVSLITTDSGAVYAQVSGKVDLSPMIDQAVYAANPPYTVKKVEYYINNKLVRTTTTKPYDYKLDSATLRNGSYSFVVRTYYTNGVVDSRADTLLVRNQVTPWYVARHYTSTLIAAIIILIALLVLLFRVFLPRRRRHRAALIAQGIDPDLRRVAPAGPTAADPMVVRPVGTADTITVSSDQSAAVAETAALPLDPSPSTRSVVPPAPDYSTNPTTITPLLVQPTVTPQPAQSMPVAPVASSVVYTPAAATPPVRQIAVHMIDDAPSTPPSSLLHT